MSCRFCGSAASPAFVTDLCLSREVTKPLMECAACGSYSFSPRPTGPEIATCYVDDYRRDFFRTHAKNKRRGAALARSYALGATGRFLDVGCSIGSMMEGFREASGWDVAGTEFDGECVSFCRSKGLNVTQGLLYDSADLPAPFQVILANNVLEHEPDPEKFLKAAHGLLAENGKLILTLPNGRVDAYPSVQLRKKGNERVTTYNEGHINFLSRAGVEALLSRSGFQVEEFKPFHMKLALKKRFLLPGSERKNKRTCVERLTRPILPHSELKSIEVQASHNFLSSLRKASAVAMTEVFSRLAGFVSLPSSLANDFRIVCRKNST